jgi:hypothetical protein
VAYSYQREGDYFLLAGKVSPGLCDIDKADAPLNWDERQGYGLSGAWLYFRGAGLSKFDVRIRVYPGGLHFEQYPTIFDYIRSPEWQAFHAIYAKPPVGTRPKAMDFVYPSTAELQIKSVVTLNELIWEQIDGKGTWQKTIRFCSYRAPKPALARPFGSKETPVPTTATEKLITDLANRVQVESLAGGTR